MASRGGWQTSGSSNQGFNRRQTRQALPTQPPVWVSGNARTKPLCGDAAESAVFVRILWSMQEDLVAYLFLFMELSCVSHCSACCQQLRTCLWDDNMFWQTYAGSCIGVPRGISAEASGLRETFRKWIFHLDGTWIQDFRDFVEESKRSEFGADFVLLLADARYVTCGLMPSDSRHAISGFAALVCELLSEYSPAQLDERREAEALASQVERRSDVFLDAEVRDVALALDRSIENAILDQPTEDADIEPEGLLDPLEDASDEERFPETDHWANIEFDAQAIDIEEQGFDGVQDGIFNNDGGVESFWRDPDDDIEVVLA